MNFTFKAKTATGREVTGQRQALDRFALAREMRREGMTLISAEPAKESRWSLKKLNQMTGTVKLSDKIFFTSNLAAMVEAGLSLSRSLDILERQTKNEKFKGIMKKIKDRVNAGGSLNQALSEHGAVFSSVFIAMVAAGERSGNLPGSLHALRDQMSKSYELRRKVKGAMIYPAVIIGAVFIVGILMMVFLLPTLAATFRSLDADLPLSTRTLIGISDFLVAYGVESLVGILGLGAVAVLSFRCKGVRSKFDNLILRLPKIGDVVKQFNSAIVMRTMASLVSSGVGMVEALKICSQVSHNHVYRTTLTEATEKIQKGISLSKVFQEREDLFPVLAGEMIEVGEETGKMSQMMIKGSEFFESEVEQITQNLSTIIEPLLMMVIGVAIGFFAVSLIGPIYGLTEVLIE